jgi:hypothetical protein
VLKSKDCPKETASKIKKFLQCFLEIKLLHKGEKAIDNEHAACRLKWNEFLLKSFDRIFNPRMPSDTGSSDLTYDDRQEMLASLVTKTFFGTTSGKSSIKLLATSSSTKSYKEVIVPQELGE